MSTIPVSKRKRIQALRNIGYTIKEVAHICNVSVSSVTTYTVPPRYKQALKPSTEFRNKQIAHCRDDLGMTWQEIGDVFGLSNSWLRKIYRRMKNE